MKTIRNQRKYRLQVFLKIGIKNCRYSIFMRLQKEQKNKQQAKNQLNFARKRIRSR